MAIHRHIGFLETEEMLNVVDTDFRELVRLSYQIPGFGSYGVSCSGHFDLEDSQRFYPRPLGSLGIATLPEMKHIPELLELIQQTTQADSDARLTININSGAPCYFPNYTPKTDLSKFSVGNTNSGLYVTQLEIRLGDNNSLASLGEYFGGSLKVEEHQEVLDKSRQRCQEIQKFWKLLEDKIRGYTNEKQFVSPPDYSKQEFFPFG
ncbi:MAG: hypothetical protein WC979_06640 [Candidatus Pacearchaeota archaeon]|jgi:hypothetical protein